MFPPRINNIIRKTQSWNEDRRELSQLVLSIIKYLHQENKRNTNQCHLGNEVVIGRIGHGVPVYWGTDLRSVFRNMRPTTNSDWIDSIQYFNLPKIKTKTIWYKFDTKVSDSNNSERNHEVYSVIEQLSFTNTARAVIYSLYYAKDRMFLCELLTYF